MSLLSNADLVGIREALKSVTDTFFTATCQYTIAGEVLDRWGEEAENPESQTHTLKVLSVFADGKQVDVSDLGRIDMSDGYLLVDMQELATQGLLTPDKLFRGNAAQDYLVFEGTRYKITGISHVGLLVDAYSLLKIEITKDIKAG